MGETFWKCIKSVGLILVSVWAIALILPPPFVGAFIGYPALMLAAKEWDNTWGTNIVTDRPPVTYNTGGSPGELSSSSTVLKDSINTKMATYLDVNKEFNDEYYICIIKKIIIDNIKVTEQMNNILGKIGEITHAIEDKSNKIKTKFTKIYIDASTPLLKDGLTKDDNDAFTPLLNEFTPLLNAFTENVNNFLVLLNRQIFTSTTIAKKHIIDKYKNEKTNKRDKIINIFRKTIRDTVIDRVTFSNKTNIAEATKANEDAIKLINGNEAFFTKCVLSPTK